MKRSSLPPLPVVVLLLLALVAGGLNAQPNAEYAENQVIVKMKQGTVLGEREAVLTDLGAFVLRRFSLIDAELWSIPGLSTEQAIDRFSGDPRIEYIEPNYVVHAADLFPDDPSFFQLWGLHNTGQTGGTPDADIDAPEAWQIQTGNDVLIGVIDTGVDWTHEDLAANIWANPGEIPDNNIDDDGNGYIDDVRGWDFVNDDNNPMDDHGHGTHVSGTIAAVGNNGIGVVGVNWSARIMPLKFLDSEGRGYTGNAILAVEYATMMGARLTNNSWGGGAASTALRDAIAASGAAGMLFIAASGNSGVDTDSYPHYPSSYDLPNIISVAWTDHNDALASHSNYGATSVDLGAPGGSIYSTLPGNTYGYFSGTSMATPHVSGVAGLLWADDPGLSNAEVKNFILSSVDTIPDLVGRTVSGGRLNAFGALHALIDTIPPAAVTDLATAGPTSNSLTLTWTATGDDGYDWTADAYDVRYSLAPIDASNFDAAAEAVGEPEPGPPGSSEEFTVGGLTFSQTYYFALKVIDGRGNASDVSNSPSGTTLGPPTVSVSPASLEESLLTGGTSSQALTVGNTGEGTLDFLFSTHPWMTVTPSSGTVWTGDDTTVTVTFDATGLSGGDHLDTLFVTSNDPDDPEHPVPVVLHVTAAPDIAVSDTQLNFGPTWIGETVTDTLIVSNEGSDNLVVDEVAIDNADFSADPAGFVLGAGEHRALPVSFAPTSEGLKLGTLSVFSNDPFEPQKDVLLQGVGGTAPVITVSANAFSANLATGETSTQYLEIGNIGGSDLIFTINEGNGDTPVRITSPVSRRTSRDGIEQTSRAASLRGTERPAVSAPKAGAKDLRSLVDLMGVPTAPPHANIPAERSTFGEYRGLDAAAGEPVDIALLHSNVDLTDFLPALSVYPDIGTVDVIDGQAVTPALGTLLQYDCVVLTINSVLADPIGMGDVLADYVDAGGAVILTEGAFTNHPPFDFSIYGRFMDEGYSPFERGPLVSPAELGAFDPFHPIMNCVDKAVSYTVTGTALTPGAEWVADLETGVPFIATKGDRVVGVNIFLHTDYWFEDVPQIIRNAAVWTAGGRAAICWASACPDYGAVVPGEAVQLEVTFDAGARCVLGGEHSDTLIVASNDPNQPEVRIALQLTVTPLPDIAVSDDELNYGSVYVGTVAPDTLVITNEGAENLTVSGILVTGDGFEADPGGFVLAPFESRELEVRFAPTAAGLVVGNLTISSDDPDEPEVGVLLSGTGVILPEIAVFPESIDDTLFAGDVSTHMLTIENNGNGDLFFEVFESEAGLSILNVRANSGASGVSRDGRAVSRSRAHVDAGLTKVTRGIEELKRVVPLAEQVGGGSAPAGAGVRADHLGTGVSRGDPGFVQMVDVPTGEPRRVLIVDSGIDMSDMRDLLLAFDEIGAVDLYHGELIPPTLETLRGYHCVIVTVNRPFNDPFAIGDVLADYVDSGGAVILTEGSFMMVFGVDYSIKGRFMDDGYCPLYVGNWFFGTGSLGDYDENHPIMKGAESAFAALITSTTLTPDAEWVADWNVGQPFIATKGAASVAMNVFLDTTVPSWTGDVPVMLRNAILWSTGERVCWVSPTPTFGTVPPHSAVDVSIVFEADAECAAAGDFSDVLVVRSNDPDESRITIPVSLRVVPRQIIPLSTDWNLVSWNLDTEVDSTTHVLSGVMDDLMVALGFDGAGLTFDPQIPPQFNTLQTMDHMHGYWLKMIQGNDLEIVGDPVAHQTPIPLSSGWNLVSYLPDAADSTAHAIGSVLPYTTVVLGYDNGGLMFDPSIPPEFNTLQLMAPGFGYWIKTTAECDLIFPPNPIHPAGPVLAASARGRTLLEPAEMPQVTPTREWVGIWGDGVRLNGGLLPVGTVVRAVDKDDVVCGVFTVATEGKFGLMAVYKDDPSTEIDEGPEAGDEVTLYLGDTAAPRGIVWTAVGDVIDYNEIVTSVTDHEGSTPKVYALYNNYPNPFNPETTIRYELPEGSDVRLIIYNIKGQVVRELVRKQQPAGRYWATWDGKNALGNPVASGVYFYKLEAGEFVSTKKMVFLK